MTNTTKQKLPEILISLAGPDTDFMKQLSVTEGDFCFALEVSPNEVTKSTGMISIPSGIITAEDVGRAHSAAIPSESSDEVILPTSTSCKYLVDGRTETEHMPIGLHGNKLQVTITVIKVPKEKLRRWFDWPAALERNLLGWRIQIVSSPD